MCLPSTIIKWRYQCWIDHKTRKGTVLLMADPVTKVQSPEMVPKTVKHKFLNYLIETDNF